MNYFFNMSLLLLCVFGSINPSEKVILIKDENFEKESYKKYFQQQEEIYQELLKRGIPGARPLGIDEALAESVLATCPKEVHEVISDIEHSVFSTNKKNIIFHGPSGTSKSVLTQAIAIKNQVPCLFFNVGTISTEYKDSGIQNLSRIFKYAQELEKKSGKPCIIIFDELEALTKKHVGTNSSESNILVSFWQELDKLRNGKVIAIGTMNNTEDIPEQIINRTSMIEVPLPNLKQTEAVLSYHLNKRADQYNLAYSEWLTPAYLARKTKVFCKRFSNRDLENLVEEATRPVIKMPAPLDGSKKIVPGDNFDRGIKKIQWQFVEKWQRTFKRHLRDPKITLPLLGMGVVLHLGYRNLFNQEKSMNMQSANHKESIALQREGIALQIANQKENVAMQEKSMAMQMTHHKESMEFQVHNQKENIALQRESMKQAQQNADYQISDKHMVRQAQINSVKWWEDYRSFWWEEHSATKDDGWFSCSYTDWVKIKDFTMKSE